jgi:tripartite-type tricarboxylate transporter receptor subunit TctC
MTLIKTGRGRAIAVTSKTRSEQLPDVPTVAETLPGFETEGWFGLVAPAGTPASIINAIHAAVVKVLRDPQNKPRLDALGMFPVGNSPAEFARETQAEAKIWEKVVRERKLAVQ